MKNKTNITTVFATYSEIYERKVTWCSWINYANQFIRIEVIINKNKH